MRNLCWFLIFLIVIIICVAVWLFYPTVKTNQVGIYQDGKLIQVLDISKDAVIHIGSTNTVTVQGGVVSVTEATCKDQICVKHGALRKNGAPIVCLPNRLVIQWLNGSAYDAVSGGMN